MSNVSHHGSWDGLNPTAMKALKVVNSTFKGITKIGGFADRDITGKPGVKSDHARGNAVDFYIKDRESGMKIANYLKSSPELKVKNVIFNKQVSIRGSDWQPYSLAKKSPHLDHVHVDFD